MSVSPTCSWVGLGVLHVQRSDGVKPKSAGVDGALPKFRDQDRRGGGEVRTPVSITVWLVNNCDFGNTV